MARLPRRPPIEDEENLYYADDGDDEELENEDADEANGDFDEDFDDDFDDDDEEEDLEDDDLEVEER